MLHVYRQVAELSQVEATVLAFKLENQDRFPYRRVELIERSRLRWWRRFWMTQLRKRPHLAYPGETRSLLKALQENQCRLLHIYFGNNGVFWLPFLRQKNFPTIVSFHGADVQVGFRTSYSLGLLQEVFSRTKRILARSESLAQALRQSGCPSEKIALQRTGIPLDQYPYVPRTVPFGGKWKLLQACRLVEKKGLLCTLHAFAGFSEIYPLATLTIAGDGPLREPLEQLALSLHLGERVFFPGFLSPAKLRDLYYDSHFFLHPSETTSDGNQEGVPNSLLEAMASGLPSIATNHGGIPEAIENERSGILVPEADPKSLEISLIRLAEDPEAAAILGKNAALAVRTKFDLALQIKNLEKIYLETLEGC